MAASFFSALSNPSTPSPANSARTNYLPVSHFSLMFKCLGVWRN
jgi:hypothetical protein